MKKFAWVLALSMSLPLFNATAQEAAKAEEPAGYQFTDTKVLPTTPIKNQAQSGTCWSFAGIALLENELLETQNAQVFKPFEIKTIKLKW